MRCESRKKHVRHNTLAKLPGSNSEAGIATATGWTAEVRFPTGARDFSLLHRVQISPRVQLASYPMGPGGSFPGVKQTTHLHLVPRSRMLKVYLHPLMHHGVVLKYLRITYAQGQLHIYHLQKNSFYRKRISGKKKM
jgi:hypothetical protein